MAKNFTSKKRTILRWVLRIVVLFVLFCFLFLSFLTLPPGERLICNMLEAALNKGASTNISIGKIETNLLTRFRVYDLSIASQSPDAERPFAEAPMILVHYNISDLLFSPTTIRNILIEDFRLNVYRDSSGALNLPEMADATNGLAEEVDDTEPSLGLIIETFQVQNASLNYQDRLVPIEGRLEQLDVHISGAEKTGYAFNVESLGGSLHHRQRSLELQKMGLYGVWRPDVLNLDEFVLNFSGLESRSGFQIHFGESSPISGRINISLDAGVFADRFRQFLPPYLYPLQSQIEADFSINGTLEQPQIQGRLNWPSLTVSEYTMPAGTVELNYEDQQVMLEQADLPFLEGRIRAEGVVTLGHAFDHSLNVVIQNLDADRLWNFFYKEDGLYEGHISGRIHSQGPLADIMNVRLRSSLGLRNVRYKNKAISDFEAQFHYQNGKVNMHYSHAASFMEVNLERSDGALQGQFEADITDIGALAALFQVPDVQGRISANGTISGSLEEPQMAVTFQGGPISYRDFPLGRLNGHAAYRDQQIELTSVSFEGSRTAGDSSPFPFGLDSVSGGFAYHGNLNGTWPALTGALNLRLNDFSFGQIHLDSAKIAITSDGQTLALSNSRVYRDSLSVLLQGQCLLSQWRGDLGIRAFEQQRIPSDQTVIDSVKEMGERFRQKAVGTIDARFNFGDTLKTRVHVNGRNLRLASLLKLMPSAVPIQGNLNFDGAFDGSVKYPRARLNVLVDSVSIAQTGLDSVKGRIRITPNQVNVDSIIIQYADNRSMIRSRLQWVRSAQGYPTVTGKSKISGTAHGSQLHLALLNPILADGMQLSGSAAYKLRWSGTLDKPRLTGNLAIADGTWQLGKDVQPIDAIRADIALDENQLKLKRVQWRINRFPFGLQGKIGIDEWQRFAPDIRLSIDEQEVMQFTGRMVRDSLDLHCRIDAFPIATLPVMTNAIEQPEGFLSANLSIEGATAAPEMQGRVSMRKLTFKPAGIKESLSEGVIVMRFERDTVALDTMHIRLSKGRINAKGYMALRENGVHDIDLQLSAEALQFTGNKQYQIKVNKAALVYKDRENHYLLDGDVVLGETRLTDNFEAQDILSLFRNAERPVDTPPEIFQKTRNNIRIREGEQIWIDNNIARLRLHPELVVIGTLAKPNIGGRLSVEEGYVLYLDRKFEISRGVLDFVDPDQIRPIVDVQAQAHLKSYQTMERTDYTIHMVIGGAIDEATVEITSDPPLDKTDILSLLTVGATRKQLSGGNEQEVSTGEILKQRLESFSSQRISGYVSRKVGNLLGLEEMSIEGNVFNINSGAAPQVVAAKKLSDRVKIIYITSVGHLNEHRIRLDYRLSDHFSLEGQTDQRGKSGIDLKYRIEFK